MTGRRKGTPCACETDPCSCGSSKDKCIRAINNVSPDPNGDFNIKAGAGISIVQSNDDEITIINNSDPDAFLAGDNIEFIDNADGTKTIKLADVIDHNGDISQTGDLTVNGNIIQNGAYYDTHAEHVYSRDDYIIMRDGAIAALAPGNYSGFQVKLYDGVNDGRLVIDSSGTARVGDVGDEQPLLTREEDANLTDGALLKWDAGNSKAVDEGTVGDDERPVKSVNGVLTPVSNALTPKGYIRAHFAGSQTIAANRVSTVNLDTSTIIDNNVFSFSPSTHKITVKKTGKYLINASILAEYGASGRGEIAIGYNSENEHIYNIQFIQNISGTESLSISYMMALNANDQIRLVAWHSAGNIVVSPDKGATNLTMVYLGS